MEGLSLNIPEYNLKVRSTDQNKQIFDVIRKKYVHLTPEEWVRQNMIHYLNIECNYPLNLMSVEKQLMALKQLRRTDLVVFSKNLKPWMVIECKAPTVELTEQALYQAARYNSALEANYLTICNGIQTFIFKHESGKIKQLVTFPDFEN